MANGIIASNFRQINKSTLVGSVDLEVIGWKLRFRDCLWHRRGDREWVNFSAKEYTDQTGAKKYMNIIEFTDKSVSSRFQQAALQAIHDIAGGGS